MDFSSNNKSRIFWLSDIHLRWEYGNIEDEIQNFNSAQAIIPYFEPINIKLAEFAKIKSYNSSVKGKVESFFNSLLEIFYQKNKESEFDYVIITGDLAFSGQKAEYDLLQSLFLSKLPTNIPVITIPGNHDCNWGTIPDILISKNEFEFNQVYKQKVEWLNNNKAEAVKTFKEYSDFCKQNHFSDAEKSKFNTLKYQLDESSLFGIIHNHKKRQNIILINSSWFAFGIKYNKILQEAFKNISTEKLLAAFSIIQEQGNLLVFDKELEIVKTKLEKFSDYFNIVLMHHPFHWLSWNEQYGLHDNSAKLNLNEITSFADLFLTGHEHLPSDSKYNIHNESTIHLKAGMLLEDKISDNLHEPNFPHNRFSILEILENGNFNELKFKLKYEANADSYLWEENNSYNNFNVRLPEKRRSFWRKLESIPKEIEKRTKESSHIIEILTSFIEKHRGQNLTLELFDVQLEKVFILIDKDKNHLLIVQNEKLGNGKSWFSFLFDDEQYKNKFLEIFENNKKFEYVGFYFLDLLIDKEISEEYCSAGINKQIRDNVFEKIAKLSDIEFDRFKHIFFNDEKFIKKDNVIFEKIAEISFYFEIIPNWLWFIKE